MKKKGAGFGKITKEYVREGETGVAPKKAMICICPPIKDRNGPDGPRIFEKNKKHGNLSVKY